MKKIFMTMAAMVIAASASAQVYIGGCAGLSSVKYGKADSKMHYTLVPEIGYEFNKNWEAGLTIGYEGVEDGYNTFELAPYARYTFCNTKLVDLFLEGTVGYKHFGGNGRDYDGFEFGIKPGLKVNLSDHVAFITRLVSSVTSRRTRVLLRLRHSVLTSTEQTSSSVLTTSSKIFNYKKSATFA